jgi:methylated-DNA-[protein]-cysteine S-methyltransferase
MTRLARASLSTPFGPVSVGCSSLGVAEVRFGRPRAPVSGEPGGSEGQAGQTCVGEARTQLAEYLCGQRRAFDLPLDWGTVSGPQRKVLGLLYDRVGYGQTVTYGGLASQAELPQDDREIPARAVGQIMHSNPIPLIVPCHRVVASDGLGGYGGGTGLEVKRWLLILEGSLPPTLDWEPATAPC